MTKKETKLEQEAFRKLLIGYLKNEIIRFNKRQLIVNHNDELAIMELAVQNEKRFNFSAFVYFTDDDDYDYFDFIINNECISVNADNKHFSESKQAYIGKLADDDQLTVIEIIKNFFDFGIKNMMDNKYFKNDYFIRQELDSNINFVLN